MNDLLYKISWGIVILSWLLFSIGFFSREKHPSQKEKIKDSKAVFGFIVEAAGFILVFSIQRSKKDFFPMSNFVDIVLTVILGFIAAVSVWSSVAAFRKLGKQWNPKARIIEDHDLIVTGPYKIVRHPIYSGMLGLMIATGYIITKPWVLALAVLLYFIGTLFRIKIEERLLLQHFGERYINYKSHVKSLIPFIF